MFSPIGKKKILLQHKFGGSPSRSPSPTSDRERAASPSKDVDDLRELKKRLKELAPTSAVAATSKLEIALSDVGILGTAMRRIMEATARYRSDRDGVLLRAFESKTLEYAFFRHNLHSVFWLAFSDEEFSALIEYFDPTHAGIVDGYSFMKAFVRLSGIRKARESLEVREKQESFEQSLKDQAEREWLAKNKRLEQGIDFKFSSGIRERAINKLRTAAAKFDPGHPAAPSTRSFNINFVKPATFREMLKLTFNLKLDAKELGAVVKEFKPDVEKDIPASEFLKYFLRLGIDLRDELRAEQRKKQEMMDKQAAEERAKKLEEKNQKLKTHVDFNFTDEDEQRAIQKLRASSEKYDKAAPGSVALVGFECEELSPLDFKELVRRVFNLSLTPTELGFLVQKYDVKKTGNIHCKTFLIEFLAMGYEIRRETHIRQLEKQRKLLEQAEKEHEEKILAVQKSEKVPTSQRFTEEDLQSALKKLASASMYFDKERSGGFKSFEAQSVDLVQFRRGVKRTFNIDFTPEEMGAVWEYFPKNHKDEIVCHDFLNTFISLGVTERDRFRLEQLEKQRLANQQMREDHERKIESQKSKTLYEVEYEFDEKEKDSALEKMRIAAKKYDAGHPAALSLQGFEVKALTGPEFKELVRRTFHLNLAAREVGALFSFFSDRTPYGKPKPPYDQIVCGDFLTYFLQLGINERAKVHSAQIERQRREDREREEEHMRKVMENANRATYKPDTDFSKEDEDSIVEKIKIAAEKFDRNHPAAPSLEAFDVAYMMPGVFRENIKNIFGVRATPKEIGYLLTIYDKDRSNRITVRDFLIDFFQQGQEIRDEKKRAVLMQQREAAKSAKEEQEAKLQQLIEKSDFKIDRNYTTEDYREAIRRMTLSSQKYDKAHPSAPNLSGFTGGPLAPGAFRELIKRAFGIYLTPKEVAAVLDKYHVENDPESLDGKKFLIMFMRLGQEARAQRRTQQLAEQRRFQNDRIQEEERKVRIAMRRVELDTDCEFTDSDRQSALDKIVDAAALYDKNAPGCVSLSAFHAKFLTPGVFREALKRVFNIVLTPEELAAMVVEFNNGSGNIDTQKFVVQFIKMGQDERQKRKLVQLEKQRTMDTIREHVAEKKKKEAEQKNTLKVNYQYSPQEKEEAFRKLAIAAKKFDKAHPAAMSLSGFEEKALKPHVFREMLKRTFNFVPTPAELGAIIHYFDQDNKGEVSSKKFLIHFIKLGIAEREVEHKESLRKLAEDAKFRERFHQEKMAAQWAKAELNISFQFSEEEKASAMDKLEEAASKFDPASPGPMGLTAFEAKVLSPAIFREMLKRCFNLLLTNNELAALINEFEDKSQFAGQHMINCKEFLVKFNAMGFQRRDRFRLAQLEKQRQLDAAFEQERMQKQLALSTKKDIKLDSVAFTDADFRSALEKIRILAANYDRSHPSAPSLKGFEGTNMKPNEFKDMLMRTFQQPISVEELAALVAFFPPENKSSRKSRPRKNAEDSDEDEEDDERTRTRTSSRSRSPARLEPRINNKDFLNYFNKIQREEQSKRHRERIQRERDLIQSEIERKKSLEEQAAAELEQKLMFSAEDEVSCVEKLRSAAKEYAIDSAPYIDLLQGFKGPALPPDKFRELFYKIFAVRFTFAELGVLLSILDHNNLRMLDGPRFLNVFYKISRIEEAYMLEESTQQFTIEILREIGKKLSPGESTSVKNGSVLSGAESGSTKLKERTRNVATKTTPSRTNKPKRDSSPPKSTAAFASISSSFPFAFDESSLDTERRSAAGFSSSNKESKDESFFNKSTLAHSWLLPSIVVSEPSQLDHVQSYYDGDFQVAASLREQDELALATAQIRDHLQSLFESDRLDDPRAFSCVSSLQDEDNGEGSSLFTDMERESSSQKWKTPSQVIDSILELEKNRLSVQTAPPQSHTHSPSQRVSQQTAKDMYRSRKTKSSPFILVAPHSRASSRISTASEAMATTAVTSEQQRPVDQSISTAEFPSPQSPLSLNGSSQWTTALAAEETHEEEKEEGEKQQELDERPTTYVHDAEKDYLQSLFSSLSALSDASSLASSSRRMVHAKDPVSQLQRLRKHFCESPMSVIAAKEKNTMRKYRMKKNTRHLQPIEQAAAAAAVTASLSASKMKVNKAEKEKPKSTDKPSDAGFFFPLLLKADVAGAASPHDGGEAQDGDGSISKEETETTVSPDVSSTGRNERDSAHYDLEFLKQLLSSAQQ